MSFTYNPSLTLGIVRLYIPGETDIATALFTDEELAALLTIQGEDPRLAAADGLDILASSIAKVQQKIKLLDLTTDGPAVAKSLRDQAAILRERVDTVPYFDTAEMVNNAFSERDRYLKQFLRGAI